MFWEIFGKSALKIFGTMSCLAAFDPSYFGKGLFLVVRDAAGCIVFRRWNEQNQS